MSAPEGSAETTATTPRDPLQSFSFVVEITGAGRDAPVKGFFREFSGISYEVNAIQYKTFNRSTGQPTTLQVAGRADPGTVTLKLGMTPDLELLHWAALVTEGKLLDARATVTVTLQNRAYAPVVTITLTNAWPSKFTMGSINVESNELQVEELTLVYESMQIAKFGTGSGTAGP